MVLGVFLNLVDQIAVDLSEVGEQVLRDESLQLLHFGEVAQLADVLHCGRSHAHVQAAESHLEQLEQSLVVLEANLVDASRAFLIWAWQLGVNFFSHLQEATDQNLDA